MTAQYFIHNQWIFYLLMLWVMPWKGVALWKASRNSHKIWFIALFLLNTLAVLEIIYIFHLVVQEKANGKQLEIPLLYF